MERGEFPMKRQLSINAVAWYESDLNRWVADPVAWAPEERAA
jgi:prophage regulatory protein